MRKRLFCLLMVFTILNASMAVQAAEMEGQTRTRSEVSEEETDGSEQADEQGEDKETDAIPETGEEPDGTSEKTEPSVSDTEPTSSPVTIPMATPGQETDEESSEAPTATPEIEPTALPEMTSTPEATSSPQNSALPDEDDLPGISPSPSVSPTPSATPVGILEPVEDELVGATYNGWTISSDTTLTENCTVNGDLTVNRNLHLGNYKIEVTGDVIANNNVYVDTGILVVHGNYRQVNLGLHVGSGQVRIGGDLRIQNKDSEGNYGSSNGYLEMDNAGGRLNIDGNFVMQSNSNNLSKNCSQGTMTLKGNFEQKSTEGDYDYFNGRTSGFKVIMAGNKTQTISLANSKSVLGSIQFDNQNIILEGAFGGKLLTNINPRVIGDAITTYNLDLNGKSMTLPANLSVVGDGLKLNGGTLVVEGDMEASVDVSTYEAGSYLAVRGDYRQDSKALNVGSGRIDIGGSLRIQSKDAEGNYVSSSTGYLRMDQAGGRLNIDGNFVTQSNSTNLYNTCSKGTMTLKGDFLQKSAGGNSDYFDGRASGFTVIMAGSGLQKISLASAKSTLGNLQMDNQNIVIDGYLNATLASDGIIKAADSGRIDVTGLKLNNHRLEVVGNINASGNVNMGGTNGCLDVTGSYVQTSGCLSIDSGRMDVTGDLRMQGQDAYGNYDVGSGYLEMSDASGRLNVDGSIVVQSTKNCNLYRGTITLLGDMVQSSYNGAVGYIRSNESHTVVLASDNSQGLLFDNRSSKVGTLQLMRDKSSYRFSFEPCWIKLNSWPFSDVAINVGNWKYDSVKYVYVNNIMNGINGTTRFDPDEPLTRAMFATVLYRMAGSPPVQFQNKFEDVSAGAYYSNAVIWAYNQGIVNGLDGGKRYGINEYITREQIAKMLKEYGRVMQYTMNESADLGRFPDKSEVSGWAVGYMQWAVGSGMVTGKNVGGSFYLDPKGNATRAECAAMLTRFMKKY